jgi:hypothetical protein
MESERLPMPMLLVNDKDNNRDDRDRNQEGQPELALFLCRPVAESRRIFMRLAAESRDWKLTTAEMQRLSKLNLRPTKLPV